MQYQGKLRINLNRIDSLLHNAKMPWSKKQLSIQDDKLAKGVGYVEAWIRSKNSRLEHLNYEKLWDSKFASEIICLNYDAKLRYLSIGADSGFIRIIEVDANNPKTRILKYDSQVHKGRVMGIKMHHKTNMMVSIGEDKFLRIFSMNTMGILSGTILIIRSLLND